MIDTMLIVTGTIAYDHIMDFPGSFSDHILPDQLHKINLSFIVKTFAKRRGGTAGNVSYSLGLLSAPHLLFSVAGNDFPEYRKRFEELDIDLSQVSIDSSQPSSNGFAMTDKTNNQIWGYFYGASEGIEKLKLNAIAKSGDLVLIGPSGASGSMSMVRQCIDLKVDYMFDPGFILTQVSDEDLKLGVTHAKMVIGNDYEIELIKKRVPEFESLKKNKITITTLGEKGATIEENGETISIDPCKPSEVVDPTGAGDSWRSGFLARYEKGLSLLECGQLGSVVASFVLEKYGTQEHEFSKASLEERYRQTYNTVIHL